MITSEYDREAWLEVQAWKERQLRARVRRRLPAAVRSRTAAAGRVISRGAHSVHGYGRFEAAMGEALESLMLHGLDLAGASLRTQGILNGYRRAGFDVQEVADIRRLSLADIDRVRPNLSLRYTSAAAIEGAGAGLLVTAGEVLTGAGVGPAAVVGTLAADTALTLMGSLRLVAHTAAYYGFDIQVEDGQEMAWALGMLSFSVSAGTANKAAAYRELSRVTQELARKDFLKRLLNGGRRPVPKSPVTKMITTVLTQLGFKASARNVEKLVPVVGIGLGAGQNAAIFRRTATTANHLCRERWLAERYGISPDVPDVPGDGDAVPISNILADIQREVGGQPPAGAWAAEGDETRQGA